MSLADALDTFVQHYQQSHERLITSFDPEWPSPCEIGNAFEGEDSERYIQWQPVPRNPEADDFAPLERALDMSIHSDIKTHYGRYWSANMEAEAPQGHVSLLFLWSEQDVTRLIENLIGHAVACRQNKTPFSVFFACTEPDSDLFLTVNNATGAIQLEEPGRKPKRTVAENLEAFMHTLVPAREHTQI